MQAIQPRLIFWVLLLPISLLAGEGERYWERFPDTPIDRAVTAVGVDAHDGLWILAYGRCFHWDAERHEWEAPALPPSVPAGLWQCFALSGNPRTGLYLLQEKWMNTIRAARLLDGKVEPVTTFCEQTSSGRLAGFWPCQGGRLLNWDSLALDVYAGGNWSRTEMNWEYRIRQALDYGDTVSICAPPRLYTVDLEGEITMVEVAKEALSSSHNLVAVWGRDRAVAACWKQRGLSAFTIATGASVDLGRANEVLAECLVHELIAATDGSVLVWANRPDESLSLFYRLLPSGEILPIPDTLGLGWNTAHLHRHPEVVQAGPHGQVWFGDDKLGVFCVDGDRLRQFEADRDRSPVLPTALALDRTGVLYAVADGGLYAYNQGTPLTGQPRPAPLDRALLGKPVWEVPVGGGVAARALRFGGHALVGIETSLGRPWGTEIVDLVRGQGSFSLAQTSQDHGKRVCAERERDCVVLAQGDHAYVVSLATGQTLRALAVEDAIRPGASRVALERIPNWRPVASLPGDRYVFTHFGGLVCLDAAGSVVWRREFQGYDLQSSPVVARNLLILQAMGGDPCQMLTCGLDADTGKTIWSQATKLPGSGMTLTGDRQRFVETNREAGVSCRRVIDGESVWWYGRFGAAAQGPPVLDPAGRYAYVYFNDAVVCLDLADGQMVWETALPSVASLPRWFYLTGGRDCLSLAEGVVLLTDGQEVLHLLDAATGAQLARFPLADDVSHHGNRADRVGLAGAPWVVGDHLVVPLATGLRAYRLPLAAYLPPGRRPTVVWAAPPAEQPDTMELALPLTTTGTGTLTVQYQIDDQEWRSEPLVSPAHPVDLGGLLAGRHRLRLAVLDGEGRASSELVHPFELAADQAPAGPAAAPVPAPAPPPDLLLALPASVSAPPVDDSSYWERFPLPPGGSPSISRLAVDEEDRVWVMTPQGFFRWEAEAGRWVDSGLRFRSGGSRGNTLCGGPQTGVYVALFPQGWQGEGQLLRLTAGVPVPTATLPRGGPRVIPASGGCVAALSSQSLSVFADQDWREWPFRRGAASFQADQVGDTLWVRHDSELILVDPRGRAKRYPIGALPVPGSGSSVRPQVNWASSRLAPWGKGRALLATSSMWIVDLRSGEPKPFAALEAALGGRRSATCRRWPMVRYWPSWTTADWAGRRSATSRWMGPCSRWLTGWSCLRAWLRSAMPPDAWRRTAMAAFGWRCPRPGFYAWALVPRRGGSFPTRMAVPQIRTALPWTPEGGSTRSVKGFSTSATEGPPRSAWNTH